MQVCNEMGSPTGIYEAEDALYLQKGKLIEQSIRGE